MEENLSATAELASVKWDGLSSVRTVLSDGRTFDSDKAFVALGRVANIDSLGLAERGAPCF
jgi:pyruvate/2-oxoglutarate dehydrogenase complex dihydrolipoamide dehydrogenase (E3) component